MIVSPQPAGCKILNLIERLKQMMGHPWVPASSDPGNNWDAIQRNGLQYEHIRDVYPINIFSQSRLAALPPEHQPALRKTMQAYGSSNTQYGRTHWILSGEEQATARSDL